MVTTILANSKQDNSHGTEKIISDNRSLPPGQRLPLTHVPQPLNHILPLGRPGSQDDVPELQLLAHSVHAQHWEAHGEHEHCLGALHHGQGGDAQPGIAQPLSCYHSHQILCQGLHEGAAGLAMGGDEHSHRLLGQRLQEGAVQVQSVQISTIQASCSSILLKLMLKFPEDGFASAVVAETMLNNNVEHRPTVPTRFTNTTLVMCNADMATDEICCFGSASTRIVCRIHLSEVCVCAFSIKDDISVFT